MTPLTTDTILCIRLNTFCVSLIILMLCFATIPRCQIIKLDNSMCGGWGRTPDWDFKLSKQKQ